MEERVGGAVGAGKSLTVVGRMLQPAAGARLHPRPLRRLGHALVSLTDLAGSPVVLNVVNSVGTPVCDTQTRRVDSLFRGPGVLP